MISKVKLIELYSAMVKCRVAADLGAPARAASPTNDAPHPVSEAVLAGVASDLLRSDLLLHASLGSHPKRAGRSALQHFYAALAKNGRGKRFSSHPDGREALATACIAARQQKTKKNTAITVIFCQDAPISASVWKKILQSASHRNLPILFVCPSEGLHTSHRNRIAAAEARIHGVPAIAVDGHDVVAVYRVASESITRARQRSGPTLIVTSEFTPPNDAGTKRNSPPRAQSRSLAAMEMHLKEQGLYRVRQRAEIERVFRRELQSATRRGVR